MQSIDQTLLDACAAVLLSGGAPVARLALQAVLTERLGPERFSALMADEAAINQRLRERLTGRAMI